MLKKIFTLLIGCFICSAAFAGQINQIVVLGDSLSDNGNLYNHLLNIIPKSPPYYAGRFSNGPTWAENVGVFYGAKSVDTQNYAVGGATAVVHNPLNDSFVAPVTITAEVYDYLIRTMFQTKANTLFVVWIGANDYLYERDPDLNGIANRVVDSISWTINTLRDQGAKNFLVMNLPDLGRTPYAHDSNVIDRLHSITVMHNQKLADMVKQQRGDHPDVKIAFVDVYSVFNDLLNNTAKYNQMYNKNITNLTTACWQGGMTIRGTKNNEAKELSAEFKKALSGKSLTAMKNVDTDTLSKEVLNTPGLAEAYRTGKLYEAGVTPCQDPNQRIFWDHIHPTATVHEILASVVEQSLGDIDI